ncbi:uncharacterized protein V1513DRAFT_403595 [Lipomyces chichibuensis]|uniref:uncharacterized protein n=1 Tax=Lipomyces chichibuensis TaxID=1546026 RepID=UPI0033440260
MSSVEGGTHERTANGRLQQLQDEKQDGRIAPVIVLSPKPTQHESWDDDFISTTPSADSSIHSRPTLRIPSEIEKSQNSIRLHLRNVRDFAAAASELKSILCLVSDRRSQLNSSARCEDEHGSNVDVTDQVLEEAEAIVALAENRDERGDLSDDVSRQDSKLEVEQRLHSTVGRDMLHKLTTLNAQSIGSDHHAMMGREVDEGQGVSDDLDFEVDTIWDVDSDEEPASPLPSYTVESSNSNTSSKLNFSADALPALIARTEKLIFELSRALSKEKRKVCRLDDLAVYDRGTRF